MTEDAVERAQALWEQLANTKTDRDGETALITAALTAAAAEARRAERLAVIEECARQCRPRGDEAWSRDAIWAGELIEGRINTLAALPPAPETQEG